MIVVVRLFGRELLGLELVFDDEDQDQRVGPSIGFAAGELADPA